MPEIPPPGFSHHAYGIDLDWIGEEGGMGARGHIPDLRFIAACNHLARQEAGYANIWDDRSVSLDETLGAVIRVWALPADPSGYGTEWAVTWHDVTGKTPGAIPLTVLWP